MPIHKFEFERAAFRISRCVLGVIMTFGLEAEDWIFGPVLEYQIRVVEITVVAGAKGREGGVFHHNFII